MPKYLNVADLHNKHFYYLRKVGKRCRDISKIKIIILTTEECSPREIFASLSQEGWYVPRIKLWLNHWFNSKSIILPNESLTMPARHR